MPFFVKIFLFLACDCNTTLVSVLSTNNKITHLHEVTLRIASGFTTLLKILTLEKDNAVKIHTKNLQLLMTEIYKT